MSEAYFDYCDDNCKLIHTHIFKSNNEKDFDPLIVAQVLQEMIAPSDKPYQMGLWILTANVFIKKYKEIEDENRISARDAENAG